MFSFKNIWFCLGISIGVLAGVLTFASFALSGHLPTWLAFGVWPAFVAWALYFAKGGGVDGMVKTIGGNVFGIVIAFLSLWLFSAFSISNQTVSSLVLGVIIIVAAFILTMGGNFKIISYVPAAFGGCACSFGFGIGATSNGIQLTIALIITMVLGAVLAHLSNLWGTAMNKPAAK